MAEELSREALRKQRATKKAPAPTSKRPRHIFGHLLAVVAALLFLTTAWAQQTVLNETAAKQVATNDTVVSAVKSELNGSLVKYGLENLVTTKATKSVLTQLVGEVYENKSIQLDLSSITNRATSEATSTLASYGVSVDSSLTSSASSTIQSVVNSQLNTSGLQEVETNLAWIKTANLIALVVSGVLVVLLAIRELVNRALGRYLLVVGLFSGAAFLVLVWEVNSLVQGYSTSSTIESALVSAITSAVIPKGFLFGFGALAVAVVGLIGHLLGRRRANA